MRIEEGKSGCAADFSELDNVLLTIAKAEYDGEWVREAPTPGTRMRNTVRGRAEARENLDDACAAANGEVRTNLEQTRDAIHISRRVRKVMIPSISKLDDRIRVVAGQGGPSR